MKRLASALAAAGLALLVTPVLPAQARPGHATADDVPRPATTALAATRPAATHPVVTARPVGAVQAVTPAADLPVGLRLDVATMSPRVVTSSGPPSVILVGTVTNTGGRTVNDVAIRLQRGDVLATDDKLSAALRDPAAADRATGHWVPVTDSLAPGRSAPFRVDASIEGAPGNSLQITDPGIYPLLVNVNGQPEFGGRARLAAMSMLLPVLSLPGAPAPPRPANPAQVSVLWPLADRPHLLESTPGSPPVLTDDDLAESLGPGGRLNNALTALEGVGAPNSALGGSVCMAIDPDLLVTVQEMSGGYQVRSGEGTVAGRGADQARQWLARLKAFAVGRCAIALPYADADLPALSHAGHADLERLALDGAKIVQDTLHTQPLPDVVWPAGGALDTRTLGDLAAAGTTGVVLDADGVRGGGTGPVQLTAGNQQVRAVRTDPLISAALTGGPGHDRATGGVATPADAPAISTQNGLATLVYKAGLQDGRDRVLVVAPPTRWTASTDDLVALLQTVDGLYSGALAVPVSMAELAGGRVSAQASLATPAQAPARLPDSAVTGIAAAHDTLTDLTRAMDKDASSAKIDPAGLAAPFERDLLRGVSAAWRGDDVGARDAGRDAVDAVAALQSQVTVVSPKNPLSWAAGNSLLPAVVTNQLPVQVEVRVWIGDTPGLHAQPYDVQLIPARGSRTLYVPLQVGRSGRFSVDVRLTTPTGIALGDPARFEATSTAYGTITLVVTGTAAAALVLLVGRRIYRRIRSSGAAGAEAPMPPLVEASASRPVQVTGEERSSDR